MDNKKVADILHKIEKLLEIKGTPYKPNAYKKAAGSIEKLNESVKKTYEEEGLKGLQNIPGVGKSIAKKIEEYLKKEKIKYYEDLKEETAVRQIVTYFFQTKGLSLSELKKSAKKREIIYSRYTRPAKQLLELAGSVENSKKAINKVAKWASSRDLDYTIETVFKKWLELDKLKPKEVVKKPFYEGRPMVWSKNYRKWYVISDTNDWLEFAGREEDIEWKIEK